jgi:hypothetical protein
MYLIVAGSVAHISELPRSRKIILLKESGGKDFTCASWFSPNVMTKEAVTVSRKVAVLTANSS